MNEKTLTRTSKLLSLVLRHDPGKIGLTLNSEGWADVTELMNCRQSHGKPLTTSQLKELVATNAKKRFAFSDDGTLIRASQGHSVEIHLGLCPSTPPDQLIHGTASRFLSSIQSEGLLPGTRQHVHLSENKETAAAVGRRHGKPVLVLVDSAAMHARGLLFYQSDNGVWLTDKVAPIFLTLPTHT